jgi:hypothetical protein
MKNHYLRTGLFIVLVLTICGEVMAQFPDLPKIPDLIPDKIPGLDKILKRDPPITNSLSDAINDIPFLDDFNPKGKVPMTVLPRSENGAFILNEPGPYVFVCQSYCLHAGTHEPTEGYGYLYAPIKGPQADIFQHVTQRSVEHPEISREDIQVLLWAMLSRTKISDMSREMKLNAAKLLTPKELFEINGGALALIPQDVLDKVTIDMPPQIRKIIMAEAALREKLSKGEEKYEELERIAVLRGVPPRGEGSRNVPWGRWTYRADGYFVRYFPGDYNDLQIELYVPEPMNIERDNEGRITSIADKFGNQIETEYDESIEPLTVPGEQSLKGYAFQSIRIERNDPNNPEKRIQLEWKKRGWTFYGVPTGNGTVGASQSHFPDIAERYEWAKKHKRELEKLDEQFTPTGSADDIMNLGNYAMGLASIIRSDLSREGNWKDYDPINLVRKAWSSALSKRAGGYEWRWSSQTELTESMFASGVSLLYLFATGNPGGEPEYDPSGDMATPGNTSSQRLMASARPTDCWDDAEKMLSDNIDKCFAEHDKHRKGGKCEKSIIKCWWNQVTWYGGKKRYLCISRDCKDGKGSSVQPDTDLAKCINEALAGFKLHIGSCLLMDK